MHAYMCVCVCVHMRLPVLSLSFSMLQFERPHSSHVHKNGVVVRARLALQGRALRPTVMPRLCHASAAARGRVRAWPEASASQFVPFTTTLGNFLSHRGFE